MNQPHGGQDWGQSGDPVPYPQQPYQQQPYQQQPIPYPQDGYGNQPYGQFGGQPFGFQPAVRRNRTPLFLGIGAAVLVVATIVTILLATGGPGGKSDEQLIEDRIHALVADYSPTGGSPDNYCEALRPLVEIAQEHASSSTRTRNRGAEVDEIENIDIDGRSAVATVRGTMNGRSESVDLEFRKEDGDWFYCPQDLVSVG